ncbi:MAG: hypothetical protein CFE44_09205 [Burkholderiales bacterium PBB4]|nr:MAG: hypothetical protein CFE44_09205 [Burkholderiales bacterium PBB4]
MILVFLFLLAFLFSGLVSEAPTQDDRNALLESGIVDDSQIGIAEQMDWESQKAILRRMLVSVHGKISRFDAIPNGSEREPRLVLANRSGVCFDRARVIEKAARLLGFDARRVFLLYGGWRNLLTAGSKSHTLVEVRTYRGWVFLGTLSPVSGFDADGEPWDVSDLAADAARGGRELKRNQWNEVLVEPFVPLYGIYSRTGFQYWPYTPMPDYSIRQIISSWIDG